MPFDLGIDLTRTALVEVLVLASPLLLIGLVTGLGLSVVQTLTQIQEQTLTFVPKIVAMLVLAAALVPWIAHRLVDFAVALFNGGAP